MDYESKERSSSEGSDVELLRGMDGEDEELLFPRKQSWLRRLGPAVSIHIAIWCLYSLIFGLALRNLWSRLPAYIDCKYVVSRGGKRPNGSQPRR